MIEVYRTCMYLELVLGQHFKAIKLFAKFASIVLLLVVLRNKLGPKPAWNTIDRVIIFVQLGLDFDKTRTDSMSAWWSLRDDW